MVYSRLIFFNDIYLFGSHTVKNWFLNLVELNQIYSQAKFCYVSNWLKKCKYSPNLVSFNKIQKSIFRCNDILHYSCINFLIFFFIYIFILFLGNCLAIVFWRCFFSPWCSFLLSNYHFLKISQLKILYDIY